jgi:hypothetical protein
MVTCSHVEHLLPLLHDGELENPLRRQVVAHVATCALCTRILSFLEQEGELLRRTIEENVEAMDFTNFWDGVATKLSDPPAPWSVQFRLWRERWRLSWTLNPLGWAGAVIAVLLLAPALIVRNDTLQEQEPERQIAVSASSELLDNQAQIESIDTELPVLFWNEPESNFTVIWVGDYDEEDMP